MTINILKMNDTKCLPIRRNRDRCKWVCGRGKYLVQAYWLTVLRHNKGANVGVNVGVKVGNGG